MNIIDPENVKRAAVLSSSTPIVKAVASAVGSDVIVTVDRGSTERGRRFACIAVRPKPDSTTEIETVGPIRTGWLKENPQGEIQLTWGADR